MVKVCAALTALLLVAPAFGQVQVPTADGPIHITRAPENVYANSTDRKLLPRNAWR